MRIDRSLGPMGPTAAAILTLFGAVGILGASPGAYASPYSPGAAFRMIADPCVEGLLGDVTGDGVTNAIDAQQIQRDGIGLPVSGTVTARIPTHGDVTGDGNTNAIDAQQIKRWGIALPVAFPIGDPMCTITVNTASTGSAIDPDGYDILLDDVLEASAAASGTVDLAGLDVGSYTVTLSDIATNCSLTNGAAARPVSIVAGGMASVTYELSCVSGVGAIRVQNTTSGPLPATNYTVVLDAEPPVDMAPGDADNPGIVLFENVSTGAHTVTIGNIPGNCTLTGSPARNPTVSEGGLSQEQYIINCT